MVALVLRGGAACGFPNNRDAKEGVNGGAVVEISGVATLVLSGGTRGALMRESFGELSTDEPVSGIENLTLCLGEVGSSDDAATVVIGGPDLEYLSVISSVNL